MRTTKRSKEFVNKIKEFYINNRVSYSYVANNSEELFGNKVTVDALKDWSRDDPDGSWSILRANKGRKTSDVSGQEKMSFVADKLYEMLIDEENPPAASTVSQLARTWLEMNVKANLDTGKSVKTSPQQVKDIFERMEAENRRSSD